MRIEEEIKEYPERFARLHTLEPDVTDWSDYSFHISGDNISIMDLHYNNPSLKNKLFIIKFSGSKGIEYCEIIKRIKTVKQMTVSQICKELGYDVEIIKGE